MTKDEYYEWKKEIMNQCYKDAYWQWLNCRDSVKGEMK